MLEAALIDSYQKKIAQLIAELDEALKELKQLKQGEGAHGAQRNEDGRQS